MSMESLHDLKERQAVVKPMNTAMRYGLIAGLIAVLFGLVFYIMEVVNQATGYLNIVAMIVLIVLAIKHHRDKELEIGITYGRALRVGVLTSLFTGIVAAIWTYIFMAFIAPDYADTILEMAREQWEAQGMDEDAMEMAENMTKRFLSPPLAAVMGLVGTVFWGTIASLIIGAIMQKK